MPRHATSSWYFWNNKGCDFYFEFAFSGVINSIEILPVFNELRDILNILIVFFPKIYYVLCCVK